MALNDILPAILIFAYLGLLGVFVLVYGRLRERTMEEYAVAGRSYSWWTMLFTVLATWIVASYYTSWFAWAGSGGAIAFYVMFYTVTALVVYYAIAPRIWKWGKLHDLYNMPDFIRLRFNSPGLAVLVAVTGIIIGAPWQVLSIKTFGFLMSEATNGTIPFNIGMALITLVVLGYIVFAGMRSVVVTDFVQGIVSTVLLFVALFWIAHSLFGGFGPLLNQVAQQHPENMTVHASDGYWTSIILTGTIGGYAWLEVFNRIFLAKDVKEVKKLAVGAPILAALAVFFLLLLGMGASLIPQASNAGESAFFVMARMAGGPVLLAGVGIIVLAAGMSSIDSQLATMGVVTSWNIVKEFKPEMSMSKAVNISRVVIVVWVAIAYFLATLDLPLLAKIAIWTYEGIVHLLPPVIFGLFWKKGNKYGAIAGIVLGLIVTYSMNFVLAPSMGGPIAEIGGFTGAIIGLPVNVGVYVIAAYFGPRVDYIDELFAEIHQYDGEDIDIESRSRVLDRYDPLSFGEDD
ncbi:sodium:solute symporter family protein [Haladaptatus caseinilyticus]|uniref:sodium:solute symporter family protein n=1 Tax=Haladaptatus caseinilyticus TaxID=2993314 RepID=UPI00224B6CCB|nr:sodium:solute symporter family protein [Haladaptatus caseinilyticus]